MNKNTNSRHWFLTWETNKLQKKLPNHLTLIEFFNYNCDEAIFQLEKGEKAHKNHWQGCFILTGVRKSKRAVLDLFKERFKNVSGLTIQRTHSQDSVELYVTKEETRLEGPFYAGNKIKFDLELANSMELKPWQQDLFDLMKNHEEFLRDRKVIYVKDDKGGSGKSTFLKYLCSQKDGLNFKKLPLDRPDRIRMMVCKITEKEDVDAFAFDFTRTMDENTSIKSMFQVLEEIKNGHIVSAMFGAPLESIIPCPFVLIFTNEDISGYYHYLSKDRWQVYAIIEGELLAIKKFEPHDRNNRYVKLTKPEGKN